MSIICFSDLKIFRSNSNDDHIIKSTFISQNGKIEIIENESTKYLELVLSEKDSSIIYLRCKLNDLSTDFLKFKSARINLKQLESRLRISYWVEFKDDAKCGEFATIIENLNQVFVISSQIEPLGNSSDLVKTEGSLGENKNLQELCDKLEKSLDEGNIENSIKIVKELAAKKVKVKINLVENKAINERENDVQRLCHVNVNLIRDKNKCNMVLKLQANEFTVLDLKNQISAYYGTNLDDLHVMINDFQTNDSDLLELYRIVRPCTSAKADLPSDFNCVVYLKSLCPDLETFTKLDIETKMEVNYDELAAYYSQDITENFEPFDCQICLEKNVTVSQGIILKDCLHVFCKECLKDYINHSENPLIKCPFSSDYVCDSVMQEREIRALISKDDFAKYELKSLRISEASMVNTVHCKTPDCIGFCVSEDNLNFFDCPVCEKVNCLRCNAIHMGKTCQEYQDDLKLNAVNDLNVKKDKEALEKLVKSGKAMYCPGCQIIVCKQEGCDWLQCAMCRTEICWVTRGPRWGPKGHGDTSGGCKCNYAAGIPCHPKCGNCH